MTKGNVKSYHFISVFRSLKAKIVFQIFLYSLIMLVFSYYYITHTDHVRHHKEVLEGDYHIASHIKSSLQEGAKIDDVEMMSNDFTRATNSEIQVYYLDSNKVIARSQNKDEIGKPYNMAEAKEVESERWEAEQMTNGTEYLDLVLSLKPQYDGYVVASTNGGHTGPDSGKQHDFITWMILASLLIAVSTLVSLVYFRQYFFKPIESLTDVSQKIAGGSFEERVPTKGDDEISVLAGNFNIMAAKVQNQIEALKKLDQMKDEFITTASHNLRTPLTTLRGYLELLGNINVSKEARQAEIVEKAQMSAKELQTLSEELLTITSFQGDKVRVEKEQLDLKGLISTVTNDLSGEISEKKITLENNMGNEPIVIMGDEQKLRQVLLNIVGNAIKFNNQGGKISIDKKIDPKTNCVIIRVKDTGIGIKKEKQPYVFDRFSRGTGNYLYQYQGVGLGLYLSKLIVLAHDGKIWFESEEGKGTSFYISLNLKVQISHL